MTFAELKAEALRRAGENPALPRFYTVAEAAAAINAAQNVFAFLTLCLEDTADLTVPAGAVLTPISTTAPRWIAPLRLELDAQKLQPGNLAQFRSLNPAWLDSSQRDTPQRYAMIGWDNLVAFPSPAIDTILTSRFATAPVRLVTDGQEPEIPAEDHPALVDFALLRMTAKEGAEPMTAALSGLRSFLEVAKRRMSIVKARSIQLSYDTKPSERWITMMEGAKWPSTLQR